MEPFDRSRLVNFLKCPKCLNLARPTVRWRPSETIYREHGPDGWIEEHLEVICADCGWSFEMAPATKD